MDVLEHGSRQQIVARLIMSQPLANTRGGDITPRRFGKIDFTGGQSVQILYAGCKVCVQPALMRLFAPCLGVNPGGVSFLPLSPAASGPVESLGGGRFIKKKKKERTRGLQHATQKTTAEPAKAGDKGGRG